MQKLLFYFIALFVLFFACTQNPSEEETNTKVSTSATPDATEVVTPTPIPPPQKPTPDLKPIPQASQKDLVYPERFQTAGINKFKGAKITNNNILDNSQGKYGQRINMKSTAKYEDVLSFYKADLENNGWKHNTAMDNSLKDEDVIFFSTNYTKDNYTLMLSVTGLGKDNTSVIKILKEN